MDDVDKVMFQLGENNRRSGSAKVSGVCSMVDIVGFDIIL